MHRTVTTSSWPAVTLGTAGVLGSLAGAIGLLSWYSRNPGLVTGPESGSVIQPHTALAIILLGSAALALSLESGRTVVLFAGTGLLLTLLTGLQDILGIDPGVDRLLGMSSPDTGIRGSRPMAPNSALVLSLSSATLLYLTSSWRSFLPSLVIGVCTAIPLALATVALLGHATSIESAHTWEDHPGMPPLAAGALVLLTTGTFLQAWYGPRPLENSFFPTSIAIGSLVATLCVWQAIVKHENDMGQWMRSILLGEGRFIRERMAEIALTTGIVVSVLLTLAVYLGQKLSHRSRERRQALVALRRARDELERRVQQRTEEISRVNHDLRREIASRQRLEKLLRQRAQLLAASDRKKDEFLAMLGHELRNPLATLAMGLEVISADDPDSFSATREALRERVQYLVRLVDDLLDVSRIHNGKIRLIKRPLDLRKVIRRSVESARPGIDEKSQRLRVSLPTRAARVMGDAVRLEQIISNLLLNAVKYTQRGGKIFLGLEIQDDDLLLQVRDNGAGIPPRLLRRVFEPFAQARHSILHGEGGLGVGLTLVQRLVELHGGTIRARSPGEGRGSEFEVRLPLLPSRIPIGLNFSPRNQDAAPARPPERSRRILVVDDNRKLADLLARLLRSWGHRVDVRYDGLSAAKFAFATPPEVALLDLGLPRINGYKLAQRLKKENGSAVQLIALSGYGKDEYRQRSQQAGFDHHLVKPVDPGALKKVLSRD